MLDGQYTVDEIVQQLQAEAAVLRIYHALIRLESLGYLTEANDTLPQPVAAFWSALDIDPGVAMGKLRDTTIAVRAFGAVETDMLIVALASLHIRADETGDLTVVLTDDYLHRGLDEWNREALQHQKPWLLVKPVGVVM